MLQQLHSAVAIIITLISYQINSQNEREMTEIFLNSYLPEMIMHCEFHVFCNKSFISIKVKELHFYNIVSSRLFELLSQIILEY